MAERGNDTGARSAARAPRAVVSIALGLATLVGLYAASRYSYLLFHSLAEGFSIAVACGVFMLTWNSRRVLDNDYLLVLGIAYLFTGALDLVHTLAYEGMGVFRVHGANLATQLWVSARYLEAVSLLAAPLALKIRLRPRLVFACYAAATGALLGVVFAGVFPTCFVEGQGLTTFKVASEYVICALLAGAVLVLYRNRSAFKRDVLRLLIASIVVTVGSEMSLTLYVDPYGFFNLLGHFLKIVSFYLIYRAVIVTGLTRPYDLLYRRLSESEERFRVLVQAASQAVWETDAAGVLAEKSPNWQVYTGQRPNEGLGNGWVDAIHPDDRQEVERQWRQAVSTGRHVNVELRLQSPDGGWQWTNVRAAPVRDLDGTITKWVGMNRDISDRKRAEEQLRELNMSLEQRVSDRTAQVQQQADQLRALASQLSQAEQSERKRLARVLHDHIQQLLAAARMQVGWMKRDDDEERMRATAQGLDGILREAIDACRSLAVDLSPPVLHEAGLGPALNWLASRMRERRQLTVQVRSDTKAEPASEEMRFLLFECVRELLFNIVKHAGVSEAEVSLVRTKDNMVKITVRDEGSGFDPDLLKKRQSDETTFGLFSIQERLAHVGGRMGIETAPGRGTRTTLTVPIGGPEQPPEDELEAKAGVARTETVAMRPRSNLCRVLIVDDHEMMREGLVGLFQFESDIEVVGQAADGPQAIELAEKLRPDAIIMDVSLGEMSGVEATERILSKHPGAKVIGLSMHVDGEVARAMRAAGATAYLTKDGPSEDLIAAVRACRAH